MSGAAPRSPAPPGIAAALSAEDAEDRRQATAALPELDVDAAAPLLLRALGDADWRVRKEATLAGRRLLEAGAGGDGAAARRLVDALLGALGPGDNVGLPNAAIEVLGGSGPVSIPALHAALGRLDADGRKLAVEALGRTGDAGALGALGDALGDPDDNVRHAAIEAIASLGGLAPARVVEILRGALGDRDQLVRLTALYGLNALEAPVPWDVLAPLMDDPMLRPVALSAAALAESPEAPAALVRALPGARGGAFAQILGALSRLVDGPLGPHVAEALRAGGPAVAARLVSEASEPAWRGSGVTEPPSWRGPGVGPLGVRSRALVLAAVARAPGSAEAAVQALAEPQLAEPAQRALLALGALALPATLACLALHPAGDPEPGAPSADLEPDHVAALIDVAVAILRGGPAGAAAGVEAPSSGGTVGEVCAVIRRAVQSPSTLVATSALYALAKLGLEEDLHLCAAQTLAPALPVARAAESALAALSERHPAAATALGQELMQRVETYLPAAIVIEARGAEGPEEIGFLAHAAAAGEARARRAAVEAAASAGGLAALDVLSAALADEERDVQLAAARALGRLCAALDLAAEPGAPPAAPPDPGAAARAGELLDLVVRSGDADLVSAATRARQAAGGAPAPSSDAPPGSDLPSWTSP